MNLIRNNLLATSMLSRLSGAFLSPDDGAGAGGGTGEPTSAPAAAAPAAPAGQTENQKAGVGETTGFSTETETDGEGSMFSMPSDDALFTLDEGGEAEPPAEKPAAGTTPATGTAAAAPAGKEPPAAPAAAPPQAPAAPAAATPPAGTAPAAAPSAPAPGTQPQGEAPAAGQFQSPYQEFISQVDANREALSKQLEGVYAISDADAEAMGLVDKAPLQRMASNLHVNVMRSMAGMLLQTLPTQIAQIVTHLENTKSAVAAFYKANPELNPETDHAVVNKYATLYWQANPKGTVADFQKQVGMMAKAELNKLVAAAQTPPPAAGLQPKKVAPKAKPSFTPANPQGGAPATGKGPAKGADIWASISEQMMNSDD